VVVGLLNVIPFKYKLTLPLEADIVVVANVSLEVVYPLVVAVAVAVIAPAVQAKLQYKLLL